MGGNRLFSCLTKFYGDCTGLVDLPIGGKELVEQLYAVEPEISLLRPSNNARMAGDLVDAARESLREWKTCHRR
jgi:hypothetical protein